MPEKITLSAVIQVPPEELFDAWLSSDTHSRFTGGKASIEATIGGRYSAWDGYIEGETRLMQRPSFIIQSWRTTEFATDAPDSTLTIQFEGTGEGTRLTLVHDGLPEGSSEKYADGWRKFYFKPMSKFFKPAGAAASKKKAPASNAAKKTATKKKTVKKVAAKKAAKTKKKPAKASKRKAPARAK